MFLTFRDLSDVKQIQTFPHIIFSGNTRAGEEEVNGGRYEGQKRVHHAGHNPGHVVGPISGLMRRFDAILVSTDLV
jgi:hypothetical protein